MENINCIKNEKKKFKENFNNVEYFNELKKNRNNYMKMYMRYNRYGCCCDKCSKIYNKNYSSIIKDWDNLNNNDRLEVYRFFSIQKKLNIYKN